MYISKQQSGLGLMEMVVAVGVFALVSVFVYQGYTRILQATQALKAKVVATNVANEQIEIIHNIPYDDIGLVGGIPSGVVAPVKNISREGYSFTVTTTIRNIDRDFDGTIGGTPDDASPADNKLVEIQVACDECRDYSDVVLQTHIAPESLESFSDKGAIRINVFDANGEDVALADVHIVNTLIDPVIDVIDVTGNNGILTIVDAPPSVESYEITVDKSGYSTDQTYTADAGNPNPVKTHATVGEGEITSVSFAIDETSDINIAATTQTCQSVSDFDVNIIHEKIIGTDPDVFKYDQDHTSDGAGLITLADMEWGTYTMTPIDDSYDVVSVDDENPFTIDPGVDQDVFLRVAPQQSNTVVFDIRDQATDMSVSDAVVNIQATAVDDTRITGEGSVGQLDWSGGSGQSDFDDPSKYASDDGNVAISTGSVQLAGSVGTYAASGMLESSTFDMGVGVVYDTFSWGSSEPGATDVQFQIATASSGAPAEFVGPDGTPTSFFTVSGDDIPSTHDGNRYMRYRMYLTSLDSTVTPTVDDVAVVYSGDCVSSGQTAFQGLASDTYTVTVTASGYQNFVQDIDINNAWQQERILMTP